MIRVLHPWETGCDDSPRWDGWESRPFSERRWNNRKRGLARSIALKNGAAWSNPEFEVASAGFDPGYEPGEYWRGDAWPQEIYLMMVAAQRRGRDRMAQRLAEKLVIGCARSSFAERWNPETGGALGAAPQGWAALASEGVRVLCGDRRG